MLKFLIILFVLIYISFRIGGYFLNLLVGGNNNRDHNTQHRKKHPKDGNVDVDYMPGKKKKGYEGGEYVDYEEVE